MKFKFALFGQTPRLMIILPEDGGAFLEIPEEGNSGTAEGGCATE
jgi:hypothetical protein